jgi:putative ABC transport system permease protein
MQSMVIAWHNLTYNTRRLLTAVAGITFAVLLMFTEVGFLHGLYDSQVEVVKQLRADIIITNPLRYMLHRFELFPRQRLLQALTVPGVKAAYPLYFQSGEPSWRSAATRQPRPIRVLAFRPEDPVFLNRDIVRQATALQLPDTALIDSQSKVGLGVRRAGIRAELCNRAIRIVGTFRLGADFINDGTVVMSDHNLLNFCIDAHDRLTRLNQVDLGLIQVAPGANPVLVAAALRQVLPGDVSIYTKPGYLAHEMHYWRTSTAIGSIFGLGTAMGCLIGVIICYQILYTAVIDHLPQFATMKAIGYYDCFLVRVVIVQAVVLALLGFIPGLVLSHIIYRLLAIWTGLLMHLTVPRTAMVLGLTVLMCVIAGSLAIRKVLSADPAEVF